MVTTGQDPEKLNSVEMNLSSYASKLVKSRLKSKSMCLKSVLLLVRRSASRLQAFPFRQVRRESSNVRVRSVKDSQVVCLKSCFGFCNSEAKH